MEYIKSSLGEVNSLYKSHFTLNNMIILGLVLYISCIVMYMPRHILSLQSQPVIKILSLMIIVYYIQIDPQIGILLTIAFLVTLNLENSVQLMENQSRNNIENFASETEEEFTNNPGDNPNDDSGDDSGDDSEESEDDSEESEEEFIDYSKKKKLRKSRNLDDNFTNLHRAMHQLQKFIPKK